MSCTASTTARRSGCTPSREPAASLMAWLRSMVFMTRVEVTDRDGVVRDRLAARSRDRAAGPSTRSGADSLGGHEVFLPRPELAGLDGPAAGIGRTRRCGSPPAQPRLGLDADARAIPNELGWLGLAVHLDKGCYRGQETVARVHNLGRPPRRLVRLHLDGSVDHLPAHGDAVRHGDRHGRVRRLRRPAPRARPDRARSGEALRARARRALGGRWRRRPDRAASQEVLVDPEVGLHVRARL